MEIQKSFIRNPHQNSSFSVSEYYEYSAIISVFDSLLSIDSVLSAILATNSHTIKLTSKIKVIINIETGSKF